MKTLTRIIAGGGTIISADGCIPASFELNYSETNATDDSIRGAPATSIWGRISAKPGTDVSRLVGQKLSFEEVNRKFAFYFKFSSPNGEVTILDWVD